MTPRTIAHLQHDRMSEQPDKPSMYYYEDETWYPRVITQDAGVCTIRRQTGQESTVR